MSLTTLLAALTSRRRAIGGLTGLAAGAVSPRTADAAALGPEAFRYSTYFNFKPGTPDSVRQDFVRRWLAFMADCPQPISPELNTPRPGQKPRPGQNFEFFSTMIFRNQADCDAYINHPLHQALQREVVLPNADMPGVFGGTYLYRPLRA